MNTHVPPADVIDWTKYQIEKRRIAELTPYARNPRVHSDEQIIAVMKSMTEFGWTMPILIDEEGTIIAGHGRVMAAERLGILEVPAIVARGWSEAQKRAYVIADNRLTELSTWDIGLLKLELGDLAKLDFDLKLTGFPDVEAVNYLTFANGVPPQANAPASGETESARDRELTPAERKHYRAAWRALIQDWNAIIQDYPERGFFATDYTRGALKVYFVRSLMFGDNIPRAATTPYTGHRLSVPGDKADLASVFPLALKDDAVLDSLAWYCQGKPLFNRLFGSLGIHGHRAPADFPATLARTLIDEFAKPGATVLDPCHGWGGRMLGFLLSSKAVHYVGFDVDPRTQQGVQSIFDDLRELAPRKKTCALTLMPYEDSVVKASSCDFALTSPPYFNVERYEGDDSLWKRWPEFDAWVDGFFRPLLQKTADALRPGCVFALQVGNQSWPLEEKAIEIAPSCGFEVAEKRHTDMHNSYNGTDPDDGEILLILRKRAKK